VHTMQAQPRPHLRSLIFAAVLAALAAFSPSVLLANDAIHIVRQGETLPQIAALYGDSLAELQSVNGLDDEGAIFEGLTLLIPRNNGAGNELGRPTDTGSPSTVSSGRRDLAGLALVTETMHDAGNAHVSVDGQTAQPSDGAPEMSEPSPAGAPNHATAEQPASAPILLRNVAGDEAGPTGRPATKLGMVVASGAVHQAGNETYAEVTSEADRLPRHEGKWIEVDLSEQKAVAYDGSRLVRTFIVSTGLPDTPTVEGEFHIRSKVPSQPMSGGSVEGGDYWYLSNVQWVQYFHAGYAFHGTYWHHNFGHPMSHGCVNMTNEDAEWLWDWTSPTYTGDGARQSASEEDPGTLVVVHE